MQHALALARKGTGLASPIPWWVALSCARARSSVKVFHQYEWRDHAEIVALKSPVKRRAARRFTSRSNLAITGRTGPCTEAIIAQAFNASSRHGRSESRQFRPCFERLALQASMFSRVLRRRGAPPQ